MLIEIANTPTHYLQTHGDEIAKAFAAGMSAQQIFTALEASECPPPMSYRSFCRLTQAHRKNHPVSPIPTIDSPATDEPENTDHTPEKSPGFKIPTFQHKDSNIR